MRAVGTARSPLSMTDAFPDQDAAETVSGGAVSIDRLLSHQEMVFRICLGHSRNYAEAEDLTQEIFLRAHQKLTGLKDPSRAREWLLRIARNACLDHQKSVRRRAFLLRRWGEPEVMAPEISGRSPEHEDRIRRLKAAVRQLPRKLRDIFVLREYGDLTYEELAATTGLKKGTVMSRLNRARRQIAAALEEKRP